MYPPPLALALSADVLSISMVTSFTFTTHRPNCAKQGTAEQLVLHNKFNAMLRHFVRMVVAPLLGVGPDDVIYQRNPTLYVVWRISFCF